MVSRSRNAPLFYYYLLMSGLVNDVRTYFGERGSKFAIPNLMGEKC